MSAIPRKVRDLVIDRDDHCCVVCSRWAEGGSIHHRRPKGIGGSRRGDTNTPPNLVLLCGSGTTGCHSRVHSEPAWSEPLGLLLRQWDDPALRPVRWHGGMVLLTATGGVVSQEVTW